VRLVDDSLILLPSLLLSLRFLLVNSNIQAPIHFNRPRPERPLRHRKTRCSDWI
jgi:hypothetical protein